MPRTPDPGAGWSSGDDGWGAATTVRGGTARDSGGRDSGGSGAAQARGGKSGVKSPAKAPGKSPGKSREGIVAPARTDRDADGWSQAGPASRDQQKANRAAEKRTERSMRDLERHRAAVARPPERGLRALWALLVVVVIAILGGLIDTVGAIEVQGGFNIGIIVASIVGILIVKRSHMFPIVIAPPIVYTLGAGFQYYLKASGGGSATKAKLDAAANYLVYGFPAIAAASAAVLIIAGIRLIARK